MTSNNIDSCDKLRALESVLDADVRMNNLVVTDEDGIRRVALADQHSEIARFQLNPTVPVAVQVHFETAKNLYLYAWFVYRFFSVAEQQALASLELALRERLSASGSEPAKSKSKGLANLLRLARSQGLICNEGFHGRMRWAAELAKQRYRIAQIQEMERLGVDEIQSDESHVVPTEADLARDWLDEFIQMLPKMRNDYAHGSTTLRFAVLRTFDIVCDLTNQLFTTGD